MGILREKLTVCFSFLFIHATMWARADLLFTDAFMQIAKDLKLGRLATDSITLRKDTLLTDSFYVSLLKSVFEKKALTPLLEELEPRHEGYVQLRKALKSFIDSMDRTNYTYLSYPFDIPSDSVVFIKNG